MVGVTSIKVQENLEDLAEKLRETTQPIVKERLQLLYLLKQEKGLNISNIAEVIGKHRGTLQKWLGIYREQGLEALLTVKERIGGGNRKIPKWAEEALAKRLKDPHHGFASYGDIQQWLADSLGIEAEYHAVYHMTRYRLKAKLKVPRPQNYKQNKKRREAFKKTF